MDAQVLTVIRCLLEVSRRATLGIKDITELFTLMYGKEYERPVTNRWIGHMVRRKFNLMTQKSHGVFVIPVSEQGKLTGLFDRYGVTREDAESVDRVLKESDGERGKTPGEDGDIGDVADGASKRWAA